ncbi:MAG TPA: NAD(P)-dependent alcohol dehydrogenase [Actinomycetota bacterium]|nr:NAD(P)-dependent alcohol dehydrogenase [Actinomycetota bacterium]
MKAAVNTRYGPPDVVRILDVERPTAAANEVLVKVHAATVNRTDCGFRAAHPWIVRFFSGLTKPKATILGCEFAGEIEAVGRDVTAFELGQRVFGFSEDRFGAHAEYLTMPQDGPIGTIPPDLSFEETAPSTEGSHYALSAIRGARIRGGQRVLVNGGTGAIGSAAIQLLKELGAVVTAVGDTEHLELVRGLGADRVIDRTVEDFTRDDRTYDVVLDAVGKTSFARCRRLLGPRGIYLSSDLGPLSQNPFLALVTPLLGRRRVMFPIPPKHSPQELGRIREMLVAGTFRPIVDRRYPLDRIVEAYRYVETGQKIGNVVITVP